MTANAAALAPVRHDTDSSTGWAAQTAAQWEPDIQSVVPVVRWAILVRHAPRLAEEHPQRIYSHLRKVWPGWAQQYRAQVATYAGLSTSDLDFVPHEKVRLRRDGKTPMLDLPRIRTSEGAPIQFDLRNCVAFCLDDLSSKVWTRVGRPAEQGRRNDPKGALRRAVQDLRSLARSWGEMFYSEFLALTAESLSGHRGRRGGVLEITTVGIDVPEGLDDGYFDDWLLQPDLSGPNLENESLRYFISEAADLTFDIRNLRSREPQSFWLSLPTAVQLPNGTLASRRALYLIRPVDDVVRVVGIGLDDSQSGSLPGQIALKVSRLLANRI